MDSLYLKSQEPSEQINEWAKGWMKFYEMSKMRILISIYLLGGRAQEEVSTCRWHQHWTQTAQQKPRLCLLSGLSSCRHLLETYPLGLPQGLQGRAIRDMALGSPACSLLTDGQGPAA